LSEALRVTATEVGKNWTTLYRKLPFDPPRDKSDRDYDIEGEWFEIKNNDVISTSSVLCDLPREH